MKKSTYTLLAGLLALSGLHAQDQPAADPFTRKAPGEAVQAFVPKIVSICVETYSLDLAEAAALYQKKLSDPKLYAELNARVAKKQAKQETFTVVRARSGERAMVENISEYIYPTEFEAPAVPQTAQQGPDDKGTAAAPAPATVPLHSVAPALPTSFETRNTGMSLEIEPMIGENEQVIDLRIAPSYTTLAERVKWGQGISETEMPVFEAQKLTLATTLITGQPQLLGTPSRPPVSKLDADSANRVWFSFVTADIIPVAKEP